MRKVVFALAAIAAVGIAIPSFTTSPAEARQVVVVKKKMHRDHGRHYGWYKHRHHRHHHGARVIVR